MASAPAPSQYAQARSAADALRVLWLTSSADTDGPGRSLLAILNHWREGDVVAVQAIRGISPAFRAACRPEVSLDALGMRHAMDLGALRRLVDRCRRFQPDVIHTQLSRADWIGRLVGRLVGVPVVSTVHNVHSRMYAAEFPAPLAWLGATLDRATAPLAEHFIAVSAGVERDLVEGGVPASRITIVPNSVDPASRVVPRARDAVRLRWNVAPDHIVVGTVALLKTQKGLQYLVDAAELVARRDARVRFVHIGDGPLESAIRARVRSAGIADRFWMLGRVADPMALLSGLDMFVLSSLWEGLPVALLEAIAANVPVIGTRVPGIEDVIDDRRTGLLVPPADPMSLADAILEMAGDPERRRRLSRAASEDSGRFRPSRVVAGYRQVYTEILADRRRVARAPNRTQVRRLSNM
jgi:glycosyltransferase involved in cell wall biosynthesis